MYKYAFFLILLIFSACSQNSSNLHMKKGSKFGGKILYAGYIQK